MVRVLVRRTVEVCRREDVKTVLLSGGVACNGRLRDEFEETARARGLSFYAPSPQYTTDNAAMIAAVGAYRHLQLGESDPLSLPPDPSLGIGEDEGERPTS